jgi:hypothetical protein
MKYDQPAHTLKVQGRFHVKPHSKLSVILKFGAFVDRVGVRLS